MSFIEYITGRKTKECPLEMQKKALDAFDNLRDAISCRRRHNLATQIADKKRNVR